MTTDDPYLCPWCREGDHCHGDETCMCMCAGWVPAETILITADREFCHRCQRGFSWDDADAENWNETRTGGLVAWLTCPECQTPADHAEAMANSITEAATGHP